LRRALLTLVAAVVTALAVATPGAARAEDTPPKSPSALPVRTAEVTVEAGMVKLSVSFRDALDAGIAQRLNNGLITVVTMRAYLFREDGGDPVALTAKSCRVVRDIWDEDGVFQIQLVQPGGPSQVPVVNLEGVLRTCCEARKLPLVPRGLLADGTRYVVATVVEVNPVSQATLDRIKRWVTRPTGSNAIGPGDSLFGSFVGLFVARIPSADKTLAFRSQAFLPPNPPPPPSP
jgi:hypothetical protein